MPHIILFYLYVKLVRVLGFFDVLHELNSTTTDPLDNKDMYKNLGTEVTNILVLFLREG